MSKTRRSFLQQTGLALLTLGFSPSRIKPYIETLAQPTNRKLALLIGINNYPFTNNLSGCVTDVELQKQLLIDRFGFNTSDILTLTDKQATRENIETAFVQHLSEQAQPGDVVVFHFSGYGTQVKIPLTHEQQITSEQINYQLINSLLPVDSNLPTKGTPSVHYVREDTLMLLGRSLATEKVTMVLDTSYKSTGLPLQGNLRVRSFSGISEGSNPEELAFGDQLKLKIAETNKQPPGIILSAAANEQIATESPWNGFSAGLFTYALTQYLWEATPASTVTVSLKRTVEKVEPVMGNKQQPRLVVGEKQPIFTYYLLPEKSMGAEGTVTAIEENNTAVLKLAGLLPEVWLNYGINSCFTLISPASEAQGVLQIRSREGLTAKAKPIGNLNNLEVGQLVQEYIRILPRAVGLTVALDAQLERIERVDATSAFSGIPVVSSVVTAGEQAADCLFAKVKQPGNGGYGLFSVGGVLMANTLGSSTEAVKSGVRRLIPQLNTLLAAKLWRLTVNEGSSRLPVEASLELIQPDNTTVIVRQTKRSNHTLHSSSVVGKKPKPLPANNLDQPLPTIKIGSEIQYRVTNYSDRPIYLILLGIDAQGLVKSLFFPEKLQPISAQATVIIPEPNKSLRWITDGSKGLVEMQVICSIASFSQTCDTIIASLPQFNPDQQQLLQLANPLEISRALLQDLHNASAVSSALQTSSPSDIYALDVNAWANLSFVYFNG